MQEERIRVCRTVRTEGVEPNGDNTHAHTQTHTHTQVEQSGYGARHCHHNYFDKVAEIIWYQGSLSFSWRAGSHL